MLSWRVGNKSNKEKMVQPIAIRQTLPDKPIMYASVFSYNPKARVNFVNFVIPEAKIKQFERK